MEIDPPVSEEELESEADPVIGTGPNTGRLKQIGRFKLLAELGRGTFAEVWLAWDPELESHVAIKLLANDQEQARERFVREARMLRRISSVNVLSVHDAGQLEDGRPWFIVDYASRGSLLTRLRQNQSAAVSYPAAQVSALCQAMSNGLAAIHGAGLIHRDIKPGNILFATKTTETNSSQPAAVRHTNSTLIYPDERILIGDLGIAKDLVDGTKSGSMTGGTLYYLAPEQNTLDAKITPAADTYAATAVLWNVLTGRLPPLPELVQPSLKYVDDEWHEFIERGMGLEPAHRFQTADEWSHGVAQIIGDYAADTIVNTAAKLPDAAEVCPFKGLEAYQAADATFFCGRESLTAELVSRLQLHNVLVVGGASGSGKSSLVRAGLVPALAEGALPGSEDWQILVMTPGNDPLMELRQRQADTDASASARLLVIDQFEEVFTQIDNDQRREFMAHLTDLVNHPLTPVKLVIVVRADFYTECAKETWLAQAISTNQVLVSPMTPKELRRALTEPVRKVGLLMESGLVEAVLNDCGSFAGSMPLMAHAMVETWVRRKGNTLTLDGFKACGGVTGAISNTADLIYDTKLSEAEQKATRSLMLKLVSASDSGPDTRRIVKLGSLEAEGINLKTLVEQLTAARLLVVDNDEIQIAHEALLQSWPRLRRWIADSHDDLRTRERITHHAHDWQEMQCNTDLLYRGTALLTAIEWQAENPDQLDPVTSQFLQQSVSMQQQQDRDALEKSARTTRFRRLAVSALGILALGASAASLFAFLAYQDSKNNELLAQQATIQANARFAGALGATAFAHVDEHPRLALVLAAESVARAAELPLGVSTANLASFDTRAAMISARQRLASGGPFLMGSPLVAGSALSIALNPQGSVLVVGQLDGGVQFFDVQSRKPLQAPVDAHSSGVRDIEFSKNGRLMVSSGADGVLLKWKRGPAGDWQAETLASEADVIPDVDFHPHDGSVFSAGDDGTVKSWFLDDRSTHPDPVVKVAIGFNAVAITPDGTHIAAGNADKTLSVWSLATNESVLGPVANLHSSHLVDLQFTALADGIVTLTTDGKSKLLSYPEGADKGVRFQELDKVGAMALDRTTGHWLVGDSSGRLSVWDVESNQQLHLSAAGHTQVINDIAITRDSRFVATLGRDQIIRFWTLNDNYRLATEFENGQSAVKGIAYSPDGKMLGFGNKDGHLFLLQLEPQQTTRRLYGHSHQIWAVAFSPDSKLFASADRSGQIAIWDTLTGRQLQIINASTEPVWSLLFSADSRYLLAGSESQIASYSVKDGVLERVIDSEISRLTRLTDVGDGANVLSTSANGEVRIHSLEKNSQRSKPLFTEGDIIWSVAVDQQRQLIASASGNETVGIYSFADGRLIDRLTGHTGGATNLHFLNDGKTLVVTDRSGMIHWWDIDSRRRLAAPWRGHRKSIWRMALHPDRIRFATAGDDGKVKVWSALDIQHACAIGRPGFDRMHRQQYFGDEHRVLACDK